MKYWELENEKYIFFWGGIFSQWYCAPIVIENVLYNCCEQYMMAKKAETFGDHDAHREIMQTTNPREQKAIGRLVKNFNADVWKHLSRSFVFKANLYKFEPIWFREILLSTEDKIIVEASPEDKIWGIGLGWNDPDVTDPSKWKGSNWLGEEIMNVRQFWKIVT